MFRKRTAILIAGAAAAGFLVWAPAAFAAPALSQGSVNVGLGQSVSVYSQGNATGVYMASNSNPLVANIQANGTQLTVTGNQVGSTTASICFVGTASDCANLYVTVQSGSVVAFGQNNVNLTIGQSMGISLSGGNGTYSVSSNSNTGAVSASINGNVITVNGLANGTANIYVCDGSNSCNTLYVTVGGTSGGSLNFSSTNPSLTIGQTFTLTVSGGSGYYVSGNTNPSVASQSISGNVLTVSGLANGTTAITVCSASNGCATLNVTVGTGTTSGQVLFGVQNPTLNVGQSMTISLSGSSGYYLSSNPSPSVVQASVSGNLLTLYGAAPGSSNVVICASGGGCGTTYVTVGASSGTGGTSLAATLAAIQTMQTQLTQILAQIQTMAASLTQLTASLGSSYSGGGTTTYYFTQFLSLGSQGAEVTALQTYLFQKGFYSGAVSGTFGTLTEAAVKAYQSAHGISPLGYVGPGTRALLNAGK